MSSIIYTIIILVVGLLSGWLIRIALEAMNENVIVYIWDREHKETDAFIIDPSLVSDPTLACLLSDLEHKQWIAGLDRSYFNEHVLIKATTGYPKRVSRIINILLEEGADGSDIRQHTTPVRRRRI